MARVQAASPSSPRSTPDLTIPSEERFNISPEECIRRLRQKGQPIRLFGESDKDRRLRLRALELLEERGPSGGQGRNDFMKALEEMESGLDKKDVERKARELHRLAEERGRKEGSAASGEGDSKEVDGKESREDKKKKGVDMGILDLKLIKTDPNKLYPIIYYALKVCNISSRRTLSADILIGSAERVGRVDGQPSRRDSTFYPRKTCRGQPGPICPVAQTPLSFSSFKRSRPRRSSTVGGNRPPYAK